MFKTLRITLLNHLWFYINIRKPYKAGINYQEFINEKAKVL